MDLQMQDQYIELSKWWFSAIQVENCQYKSAVDLVQALLSWVPTVSAMVSSAVSASALLLELSIFLKACL